MMTKLADYSQEVTGPELDAALRAGGFDGVFHYIRGTPGWVSRIETLGVVVYIRYRGWWQLGIDVPLNPSDADGAAMVAAARAYGFPKGSLMALDVEPERFVLDREGWARAADAWCDGVRAGGYSPGPYGTDETVAACGSRADWIWRAKPDQCDPAGPGLADAFFAGRRIVQCSNGVWGGVEFDVSYSQVGATQRVIIPGGDMSIALRPDGSGLLDWFEADGPDRHCAHRALAPGQSIAVVGENIGGATFIPGSFRAWWNSTTTVLTVMGQVDGGAWWAVGWNGGWGTWLPTGVSTALPAAVPSVPDDDGALTDRITTLEADLAAIKAAIK